MITKDELNKTLEIEQAINETFSSEYAGIGGWFEGWTLEKPWAATYITGDVVTGIEQVVRFYATEEMAVRQRNRCIKKLDNALNKVNVLAKTTQD